MTDTCGKNCRAYPRRAYCSDRTCGASDCRTCMGEGVCHDTCDVAVACDACDGGGTVPCDACDGDGNNLATADGGACRRCKGHGEVPCSDCDGTGKA